MRPPVVAEALVSILTPPGDFESVVGDLHEEYVRRLLCEGRARADSWYWMQTFGSIPPLLSYSRAAHSVGVVLITCLIVLVSIVAMLCVNELIGDAIHGAYRTVSWPAWPYDLSACLNAACFGALIAASRRAHGMRLVMASPFALLAFIALPIAFRISSPLSTSTWALVLGGAASMAIGGATYHLARLRFSSKHL